MSYTLLLINAIKISQNEEYINPVEFNSKLFKEYRGWIMEVLTDLDYIYLRISYYYWEFRITVEFVVLPDLFEINRDKKGGGAVV